jgi:hypothetical protein
VYNVIGFKTQKEWIKTNLVIDFTAKIRDTRRKTNSELNAGGAAV